MPRVLQLGYTYITKLKLTKNYKYEKTHRKPISEKYSHKSTF